MSTTTTSSSSLHPIRRRPRICKTCLSCRASKVRCDRNLPCGNCVKRDFTCSYSNEPQPPPPTTSLASLQQQQQQLPSHQVQRPRVPFPTPATATATTTTPSSSVVPSVRVTPDRNPRYTNDNDDDDDNGDDDNGSSSGDDDYADSQEESLSDNVSISQAEWDDIHSKMGAMEQILASLHSLFEAHSGRCRKPLPVNGVETSSTEHQQQRQQQWQSSPHSEDAYRGSNPLKPSAIHIGSRSALVDIQDKSKRSDDTTSRALPKDDLLAELALGNQSVAYPFVDLWSSDPFTFNIVAVCEVLPVDEQCYRYVVLFFFFFSLFTGLSLGQPY